MTGANVHDKWMVGATSDVIPICGLLGPILPKHICLDKGYDYDDSEQEPRERGVKPHIRRRGEPSFAKTRAAFTPASAAPPKKARNWKSPRR